MDTFYLKNAAFYQKSVDSLDLSKPAPHFSRHEAAPVEEDPDQAVEQCNPDIIIGARIRPMLEIDIAAGFPCAVYPRSPGSSGAQIVDIHDLYHHPLQQRVLKVSAQTMMRFSITLLTTFSPSGIR